MTSVDDGDLEGEGGEDDSVGGAGVEDAEEGEVEAKELEGEEFGGDSGAEEGGMVLGGGEPDVRDRGSNMVKTLRLKLEDALSFTCPTPLSGICIGCYIECCNLVHIISFVHHASS